ncbi:transposase [Streptomyces sp. NPDC058001]|uniref:transposase n=1 Tax=Streptomyces sp. NPDC058001 TaxID=3346300 RepID=UPI0036E5A3EE
MRRPRYPSDTSNAEWALIEPLLPPPACKTSRGGRPEKHPRRESVDAIRYVVDTGCTWRAPTYGFPSLAHSLGLHGPLSDGRDHRTDPRRPRRQDPTGDGQRTQSRGHYHRLAVREGGLDRRQGLPRLRLGQKDNGPKRYLVVDTRGLPLLVTVTPADPHDSAAAKEVLFRLRLRLRLMHPEITRSSGMAAECRACSGSCQYVVAHDAVGDGLGHGVGLVPDHRRGG